MRLTRFNIVIFIGFLAIVGVIIMQLLLLNKALKFEKKELESKIFFALQDVVERIYADNKSSLTFDKQIQKVSDDYYMVNVNDVFENAAANATFQSQEVADTILDWISDTDLEK